MFGASKVSKQDRATATEGVAEHAEKLAAPGRSPRRRRRASDPRSGAVRFKRGDIVPGTSRLNNFDALRLLAALAVLISHSFAIADDPQPAVGAMDVGTIGVVVFFGISGFLISQSWTLDPRVRSFLIKRCLRIFPALIVLLLFCTLLIGPLVTGLSVGRYFADAGTWTYLVNNALLLTTHELPGVFTNLPYPRQVNASLWTLQVEFIAYLAVAVVGVVGALRRMWFPPLLAAVLIVAPHGLVPWSGDLFMLQAFAVGATLYIWREYIPWHWGIAAVGLAAWAVTPEGFQLLLAVMVIPYATILIAYRGPQALRRLTTHGDFSYGLYLWAWPVGQIVTLLWGGTITTAVVIGISLPVTYALAAISWKVIEKPSLELKKRFARRSAEPRVHVPDAEPVIMDGRRVEPATTP